jgi:hypothetical protein
MGSTLDAPPVVALPPTPQVNPNFAVVKIDAPAKNQPLLAAAMTTQDVAAALNACYAVALSSMPTLTGTVAMQLAFDTPTHVGKATDAGSTLKGPILACVSATMASVTLLAPLPEAPKKGAGAAKPTVTLMFTPSTSGPGFAATVDLGSSKAPHGPKHR